jgi:hypothetical protein
MLALSHLVVAWSASGHVVARAVLCDRRVRSLLRGLRCCAIRASDHDVLTVGAVTVGGSDAVERVWSVTTGASGHPEKDPVKG